MTRSSDTSAEETKIRKSITKTTPGNPEETKRRKSITLPTPGNPPEMKRRNTVTLPTPGNPAESKRRKSITKTTPGNPAEMKRRKSVTKTTPGNPAEMKRRNSVTSTTPGNPSEMKRRNTVALPSPGINDGRRFRRKSIALVAGQSFLSPTIVASVKDPGSQATEILKKRLEEAIQSNNSLKKENGELKTKLSLCLNPEQTQRLKNDNKRLLGLTERVNAQRSVMEERFKEKKLELQELEKELSAKKEELDKVIADRNKLKSVVENVLSEVDKHKDEIKVLKDGKSFADFVELKRQIKQLKEENAILSQGLQSDPKGSLYFNLNDLATMLHLKEGTTIDALSQRHQNQRVVVLDERELEESIRKGDHSITDHTSAPPCCRESPVHHCSYNMPRPLTSRQSRINFISPPRSSVTSPRVFSRQCSREKPASWSGSAGTKTKNQNHFIAKRRSSPRWPSLSELNERYQLAMQGAWTAKPSIEEVSEYIKNRQRSSEN